MEDATHHKAEIILGQVDHGRIEVGALIEGICDDSRRKGRRGLWVFTPSQLIIKKKRKKKTN